MKKSGSRVPRIELEDMGPSVDFIMRRTKLASEDLYKRSLKVPKTATVSKLKVKNVYRHLEIIFDIFFFVVVGWCEGVMYLVSPGRPTDIGLQLGKACYR